MSSCRAAIFAAVLLLSFSFCSSVQHASAKVSYNRNGFMVQREVSFLEFMAIKCVGQATVRERDDRLNQ